MGRVRVLFAVVALAGCDAVFRIDPIGPDAPPADGVLAPDADCAAVGAGFIQVCAGGPDLVLAGAVSTDNMCSQQQLGMSRFCLITADHVTIGDITVIGSVPLVIAARRTIAVSGFLDASAINGAAACMTPGGVTLAGGASGGPGGSSQTPGGAGGASAGGDVRGAPPAASSLRVLQGGCEGGSGGAAGASGGAGGRGGGAVYLVAGDSISIGSAARISASGGGGEGGRQSALGAGGAGGGGGAGGMLVLDAPAMTLEPGSTLWANGGGGGGGGAKSTVGVVGGESASPSGHGLGGTPNGGRGATGEATGDAGGAYVPAGPNGMVLRSAGGGGGGVGWIFYYGAMIATVPQTPPVISPPPKPGP